jgi:hypothetical protein
VSNLAYLGLAAGLSIVGLVALWLARRRPRSMQAGMEAFSRELQALAPPDTRAQRRETHVDQVSPAPIRPRPTSAPTRRSRRDTRASRGATGGGRGAGREGGRGASRDDRSRLGGHEAPGSGAD